MSEGYIDGLVQDCNISIANALEILQSCTKRSMLMEHGSSKYLAPLIDKILMGERL